ncbi:YcdB/YcdC domain-containing protein [Acetivibrio mesophilus]|uniref:Peptidase M4 n=1 Tax=Acetivibrio mesophilus TaxID=2487273 RepID=A0A4Q0I4K6_9FIRM|nr:YcdB/YcdC domain-containing protein [Acetivibrio mesophilus]ODM27010.1 peptidase M4 [Clostridium sp. Bc-iso-3]RXE59243.1 peptidase M4 [Acetivibrio mesophilus]HHV29927.1 peptidase M4 [Clostridium sp.]
MKNKLVLVIALVMIVSTALSGVAFAKEDTGLQDAIKRVKQLFVIPEENSEFSYAARTMGDITMWMLDWQSKGDQGSSISVAVDSTGDILNYYYYKNMDQDDSKLPKVSRDEAKAQAEGIIEKINPGILDSLKLVEGAQYISIYDRTYYFSYVRTHNGIDVPSDGIWVEINKQTGELVSYNKTWNKDFSFPSTEKIISLKEAQEAYVKNLGLRLTYNTVREKDGVRVYAAYTPIYGLGYYIDAITGERFVPGSRNGINEYMISFNESEKSKQLLDAGIGGANVVLTPEEMEAVEEVAGLLTQKDVEKIARELKVLELDDTFNLEWANLSKDWPTRTNYNWNLYFLREGDENGEGHCGVDVSINAKTGEIVNFNISKTNKEDVAKFDREAAKKTVEEFLKEIQPEKFKETEYDKLADEEITSTEGEQPIYLGFNYTRLVNGVLFPNNGIRVGFNAATGKIESYSLEWYDVKFPSVEKAVELEKIYEIFFKEIGLELQYIIDGNNVVYVERSVAGADEKADKKTEAKLVYAVNTQKPARFDADTGAILDSDGKPYKENKALEYTDISDHYAKKQIELLAQIGVGLEGPELKPDEKIKQKDFMLLISQVLYGYQFYGKNALTSDEETEDLYKMLIRQGIIKEDEKNPEAYLTREDSVKFVIRTLNYGKVAEISDIFNCTFKDKDEINPELIGHVVIAKGLKIVNGYGEYFRPKDELKKADALIIIYNYLQI